MKTTQSNNPAKRKVKRPPLFVYVGYLLVAAVVFTGVTFSSYVSTTVAQDEARVAKFEIKGNCAHEIDISVGEMIPGETVTKSLTVENASEVSVELTLKAVLLYHHLPLQLTINSVDATPGVTYQLPPNNAEQTYTLTIHWPKESSDAGWAGKTDVIKLTMSALQTD